MEWIAAYIVAFGTMLFAGLCSLTLIYTVKHLDPEEAPQGIVAVENHVAA